MFGNAEARLLNDYRLPLPSSLPNLQEYSKRDGTTSESDIIKLGTGVVSRNNYVHRRMYRELHFSL